jgi:large subunit ribosomal protein L23
MRKLAFDLIVRPLVTEKVTALREKHNQVVLRVRSDANRVEVKRAVEATLNVKVARVNMMTVHGKVKRLGRHQSQRPSWKKAIVILKPGEKLELFEGV